MNLLAVTLLSETDWEGFSQAVRFLVRQGVSPDRVIWRTANHRQSDLFDAVQTAAAADLPAVAALQLPASFVETARLAFLHKAHARFDLLYRTAWRVVEDRRRWQNPDVYKRQDLLLSLGGLRDRASDPFFCPKTARQSPSVLFRQWVS